MKNQELDAGVALYTANQVRNIELSYAKKFQTGAYPLMEAAGESAYQQLKRSWPQAKKILVVCGKGNNAGDGFVLARLALEERKKVTLCHFDLVQQLKGDALTAFKKIHKGSIQIKALKDLQLDHFDVIVDAMLGTGIKGAIKPPFIDAITNINKSKSPVLAIDLPSGIDADTGNFSNQAIKANVTVTFVGHKRGLYTGESPNYRGQLYLVNLNIPQDCYQKFEFNLVSENWNNLKHKLKPRSHASHKGHHGHCLIIGGAEGMTGAAILAATASARSGSGTTSAWLETGAQSLNSVCPEVMAKNVKKSQILQQADFFGSASCLVVGPGLGKTDWGQQWMGLVSTDKTIRNKLQVWDADALNWLAENSNPNPNPNPNPNADADADADVKETSINQQRILTPHPAEAGRLLAIPTEQVNQDRFAASAAIAQKFGGVCVLKGAGTIISDSKGLQIVCAVGNPGMASGGMGDVLSGIIGSLLAQGFSLLDAAVLGVCIHGEAGDRAAGKSLHYRGMLASDLFKHLPVLLNP